ncbi:MAG: hypothetical protein RIG62_10410 [Cyclobacteriaceae bacterium]|jgi:hypothetical protein
MMNFDFTRNLDSINQDFSELSLSDQLTFLEALENYRYQLEKKCDVFGTEPSISYARLDYLWRILSQHLLNANSLSNTLRN